MDFTDVLYSVEDGIATITINRPERLNAFTNNTVNELVHAFMNAWADRTVGAVILTGAGDRAFCTGGDQSTRSADGYSTVSRSEMGIDIQDLQSVIRDIPKPVIAAVNGYAIGGGHVLHVLCDLTIAAESARFGQVGPRVGSVDLGFGTAYLAAVIGEKRAREMWLMCRKYTAQQALDIGLVNAVVPDDKLRDEARAWAAEIVDLSPTALRLAKQSFNVATEMLRGLSNIGMSATALYYGTDESLEGRSAFMERRRADYGKFRQPAAT
jgi:2-ketocyclohexanecarboxyl-CoA hydrolase